MSIARRLRRQTELRTVPLSSSSGTEGGQGLSSLPETRPDQTIFVIELIYPNKLS